MKSLTQPWNLSRSFGSQPVGSVAGPRTPEAGIAAQVASSQSSRWTFRGHGNADLPTWSWMTAGISARPTRSGCRSGVASTFNFKGDCRHSRSSRPRQALPRCANWSNLTSRITGWNNLPQPPFLRTVESNQIRRSSARRRVCIIREDLKMCDKTSVAARR